MQTYNDILTKAADVALNIYGLKSEAINLNILAENYDKAFEIMSEEFSSILDPLNDYNTVEIRNFREDGRNLWENYHSLLRESGDTFRQLFNLIDFTECVKAKRYQEAYVAIYKPDTMTTFFPEDSYDVQAKVSDFGSYDRSIQRIMHRILLDTMVTLTELYKHNRLSSSSNDINRKAKALEEYASLLSGSLLGSATTVSDLARLRSHII